MRPPARGSPVVIALIVHSRLHSDSRLPKNTYCTCAESCTNKTFSTLSCPRQQSGIGKQVPRVLDDIRMWPNLRCLQLGRISPECAERQMVVLWHDEMAVPRECHDLHTHLLNLFSINTLRTLRKCHSDAAVGCISFTT